MQVIDEDEMENVEGLEDIGQLAIPQEIAYNRVSETPKATSPEEESLFAKIRERYLTSSPIQKRNSDMSRRTTTRSRWWKE
jgi:hypothetical protein